jgi:phosphoribosylamine--glycine ligase
MGAYSPVPFVDDGAGAGIWALLERTVQALEAGGVDYRGVVYAGLMLTTDGPKVLEFNCRFGDPETQSILPRLDGDLLATLAAAATGDLAGAELTVGDDAAVTVVIAAGDYPERGDSGSPIVGTVDAEASGALVFHAGTAVRGDALVTNGGRILNVTGCGPSVADARSRAYAACDLISFPGMRYRRDIALEPGLRAVR